MRTCGLALLALIACAVTGGEDDVPEIVVTAQLRDTALEHVPSSVTVLTENVIAQREAQHLEEIMAVSPNVNLSSGGSRARFIQIRGIGERGQFAEPLNSSVGVLVDGVDFSGAATAATLFDIQQVEILRGPQGTLYGANALAGLVNIVTNRPTPTFESNLKLTVGDYGMFGLGGTISNAVTDRSRFRIAVQHYSDDGFMVNEYLGRDDTNDHDELTVRAKLTTDLSESAQLDLTAGLIDIDNGYDAFSLDNNRITRSDQPGQDRQESAFVSAELRWEGNKPFDLIARFGVTNSDIDYGYDEDWTHIGFDPWEYSSTDRYRRDRSTMSGELRLVSSKSGPVFNDTTDWTFGVYSLDQNVDLRRDYTYLPIPYQSEFSVRRAALFGETRSDLGNGLQLILGLRFERHSADYSDTENVRFDPSDTMVGGRLALEYQWNPSTIVYTSLARGYKAGGFNTDGSLDADLRRYEPESLINLEVGLSRSWADETSFLRASVFRMARHDVQIASSLTRVRIDGSAEFIDYVGNAAEGSNIGVEMEVSTHLSNQLRLFANVGMLRTEYRDFVSASGENYSGRDQAHAPEHQYSAGVEFSIAQGWLVNYTLEGRDAFFFSDSHDEKSRAYNLSHLKIGYETDQWSLAVWGRNLGHKDYFVRGYYFGNDPRDYYTARAFTQLGEPRRYGITFRYHWR
ncbi:MAG TPA: TonB-dependent receptor [Gammaproteobacteria bacterium]|nr:TonB-dependent receptor [Gammaproteobacteria bacterium]